MNYQIGATLLINNKEWRVAEYRMGRGREWVYTLSYEHTDGSNDVMCVSPDALNKIFQSGEMVGTGTGETIHV